MTWQEIKLFDRHILDFGDPTLYQFAAILRVYNLFYPNNAFEKQKFFDLLINKPYKKIRPILHAAYITMFNRENLPDQLSAFMPKEIKHYCINPKILLKCANSEKIHKYITDVIASDFELLRDNFFKLGGMSAKKASLIRARNINNVVQAFLTSDRYKNEIMLANELNCSVTLYFNEFLKDCDISKEIRCFVIDSKIAGITAYNIHGINTYSPRFIENAIAFINKNVLPMAIDWRHDFVIDLFERKDGTVQTLEFNPTVTSFPGFYAEYKNIGKPFIIEKDDHYDAIKVWDEFKKAGSFSVQKNIENFQKLFE